MEFANCCASIGYILYVTHSLKKITTENKKNKRSVRTSNVHQKIQTQPIVRHLRPKRQSMQSFQRKFQITKFLQP